MMRSRCVSEGVRTVCPMATSGMYVPEEVRDMPTMALPEAASDTTAELDQFAAVTGEAEPPPPYSVLADAREAAERGTDAFRAHWLGLSPFERDTIRQHLDEFQRTAKQADNPFGLPPIAHPEQQQAEPPLTQPDAGPASGSSPADAGQPCAPGDVFAELDHEARAATRDGKAALEVWWKTLRKGDKDLLQPFRPEYDRLAAEADAARGLAL